MCVIMSVNCMLCVSCVLPVEAQNELVNCTSKIREFRQLSALV